MTEIVSIVDQKSHGCQCC